MPHSLIQNAAADIKTPAYVADAAKISANMAIAAHIKARAGVTILLATKAFAMPACFAFMRDHLDGTTASGLYEARLGAEHFGKDVHTYCPAYTEDTLRDCLRYSDHIYFNSTAQLKRFAPIVRAEKGDAAHIGLRVNPGLSLVTNSALYDPSSPGSRFGVQPSELTPDVLAMIDTLHVHNLCENMAQDSVKLLAHISQTLGNALKQVQRVNIGGGHYITHPDYDREALIAALIDFQKQHNVQVIMEPGGTMVYEAGYLVGTVLDIFENSCKQAILDVSASTHMPDVLEVPYRPHIIGSSNEGEKPYTYKLGGNTCMTGDIIGDYSFDAPLEIGQKLIFTDMMQYSLVKNNTFNGVPLPDLALLHADGRYEIVREFGYDDFAKKLF